MTYHHIVPDRGKQTGIKMSSLSSVFKIGKDEFEDSPQKNEILVYGHNFFRIENVEHEDDSIILYGKSVGTHEVH